MQLQPTLQSPIPLVETDEEGRKMSWVYVGDIARAVVWLLSDANQGAVVDTAVNIASDEQITFKEMMRDIADELGLRGEIAYAINATTDLPSVKLVSECVCA